MEPYLLRAFSPTTLTCAAGAPFFLLRANEWLITFTLILNSLLLGHARGGSHCRPRGVGTAHHPPLTTHLTQLPRTPFSRYYAHEAGPVDIFGQVRERLDVVRAGCAALGRPAEGAEGRRKAENTTRTLPHPTRLTQPR